MTRINVLSDLHYEFGFFHPPQDVNADFTVIAGDTITKARLHPWPNATEVFGHPVVMVAGNHDYYGHTIDKGLGQMRRVAAEDGTLFLENNVALIGWVRVLGCTLWTDYCLFTEDDRDRDWSMAQCTDAMNDHRMIRVAAENHGRFLPRHAAALHARSVAWLEAELARPFPGPTIVVTHHCPSARCLDPQFPKNSFSAAYASNLEPLIERWQPELWVSGHTHYCVDFRIGRTRVLANQRGYAGPELDPGPAEGFDPRLVIEV